MSQQNHNGTTGTVRREVSCEDIMTALLPLTRIFTLCPFTGELETTELLPAHVDACLDILSNFLQAIPETRRGMAEVQEWRDNDESGRYMHRPSKELPTKYDTFESKRQDLMDRIWPEIERETGFAILGRDTPSGHIETLLATAKEDGVSLHVVALLRELPVEDLAVGLGYMLRNFVYVNDAWHIDELEFAYGEVVTAREEFLAGMMASQRLESVFWLSGGCYWPWYLCSDW